MGTADVRVPGEAKTAIVLVSGQVASGKSTVSRALAERLGAIRLEADRIRGTLLEAAGSELAGAEARWRRDLSAGFEDEIYGDLLRRANEVLGAGRPLVIDACFPRRVQREAARALAARHGLPFLFVECHVPEEVLRARLSDRDREAGGPVWELIHRHLAQHFEPIDHLSDAERIVVRSDGPTDPTVAAVEARLRTTQPAELRLSPLVFDPLPRVVSFDCWGTLLSEEDWTWAHGLRVMALRDAAREAGRAVTEPEAAQAFDAAWRRHMETWEAGQVSGASEVATWGLAELGIEGVRLAQAHLVRRFEEASHTSRVVALEGARALLAALDASQIPCVLVCDTGLTPGRVVRRLLEGAGLLPYLRVLSFSDEVGAPKPDRRAFLAALEPLHVEPEHALHVGDLRRKDVAGARALGMRTVRIRARHDDTSDDPEADRVVNSHAEFAELLGLQITSH